MIIERPYTIEAGATVVWDFIKDIEEFIKCVPDLEQVIKKNDQHFILVVRPKLAFIKGSIEMDCTVQELKNSKVILKVKGKSIGGSFESLTEITLTDKKNKTGLIWKADVTFSGLLKHIPESVMRATACFIADRMIKNINTELSK